MYIYVLSVYKSVSNTGETSACGSGAVGSTSATMMNENSQSSDKKSRSRRR